MENISKDEALAKLANRVRELRLNKGVSQQEAYIDTSLHFGRIEQGKRDINYTSILRICSYFEISINDFFNY